MNSINYPRTYDNYGGAGGHIPVRRSEIADIAISIVNGRFMRGGERFPMFFGTHSNAACVCKDDAQLRKSLRRQVRDRRNALRLRSSNARWWNESAGSYGLYKYAADDSTPGIDLEEYEEAALVQLDKSVAWWFEEGGEALYIDFEGNDEFALRAGYTVGTVGSNGMQWSTIWANLQWNAVLPILNRINTINGIRYCEDPRILWLFTNENGFSQTFTSVSTAFNNVVIGAGGDAVWKAELDGKLATYAASIGWTVPAWSNGGTQGFPNRTAWLAWGTVADREKLVDFIDQADYNFTVILGDRLKALRDGILFCPGTFLYQSPRCSLALPARFDNNVFVESHDYFYADDGIGVGIGSSVTRRSMLDPTWANVTNGFGWVNSINGITNGKTPVIAGECGQYGPNRWRYQRIDMEGIVASMHGHDIACYADSQQVNTEQMLTDGSNMTSDHACVGSACDRLVSRSWGPCLKYGFIPESANTPYVIYSTPASLQAKQHSSFTAGIINGAFMNSGFSGSGYENWVWADTKVQWIIDPGVTPTTVWTGYPKVTDATLAAGYYIRNTGNGAGCEKIWLRRGVGIQLMNPYMAFYMDTLTATPEFSQIPMKMASLSAPVVCARAMLRSEGPYPLFTGPMGLFIHGSDYSQDLVNRSSSYTPTGGVGEAAFMSSDQQTVYYIQAAGALAQSWSAAGTPDKQRLMMPEPFTLVLDTTNNGLNPAGTDLDIFGITKEGVPVQLTSSYDSGTKVWTHAYTGLYPEFLVIPVQPGSAAGPAEAL